MQLGPYHSLRSQEQFRIPFYRDGFTSPSFLGIPWVLAFGMRFPSPCKVFTLAAPNTWPLPSGIKGLQIWGLPQGLYSGSTIFKFFDTCKHVIRYMSVCVFKFWSVDIFSHTQLFLNICGRLVRLSPEESHRCSPFQNDIVFARNLCTSSHILVISKL